MSQTATLCTQREKKIMPMCSGLMKAAQTKRNSSYIKTLTERTMTGIEKGIFLRSTQSCCLEKSTGINCESIVSCIELVFTARSLCFEDCTA